MKLIFADILMVMHLLWAGFMVIGLPLGLYLRSSALRWIHFAGMFVTAFIAAINTYCPLTIWEEILRWGGEEGLTHHGNFLTHHISKILYPGVEPQTIRIATIIWGLATLFSMVLVPPGRQAAAKKP
jgi:hypothetical protein